MPRSCALGILLPLVFRLMARPVRHVGPAVQRAPNGAGTRRTAARLPVVRAAELGSRGSATPRPVVTQRAIPCRPSEGSDHRRRAAAAITVDALDTSFSCRGTATADGSSGRAKGLEKPLRQTWRCPAAVIATGHLFGRSPPRIRPRRTVPGTSVLIKTPDLTTGAISHRFARIPTAPGRSVERHLLVPVRDVGIEPERAHLRLERDLRVGVAVDEEDAPREARRRPALAVREAAAASRAARTRRRGPRSR